VRNKPITAANLASGGHSRSQKMLQRARRTAVPSRERAVASEPRSAAAGWFDEASVTKFSAENVPKQRLSKGAVRRRPHPGHATPCAQEAAPAT
jgi:hypothetical protein